VLITVRRDHVELPDDFSERAEEIMERHRSSPVSADIRGGCRLIPRDLVFDLIFAQTITMNDPLGTGTSSTRTTRKRECDAEGWPAASAFSRGRLASCLCLLLFIACSVSTD
jgi:hypothetical protein